MVNSKRLRTTKSQGISALESHPVNGDSPKPRLSGSDWQSRSTAAVRQRMAELTDNFRFADVFTSPVDLEAWLTALRLDLKDVPVLAADGSVTDCYSKLEAEPTLTREDKDLIWNCMALVRSAFLKMEIPNCTPETKIASKNGMACGGYQWEGNWKHIRAEVDQVLEAAKLLRLSSAETRDAIIASMFSDAIKNRKNFIIHNIHGAQGAALALAYFLDPNLPEDLSSIERIATAVKQHQIAPPEFMARAVTILISKKLNVKQAGYLESSPESRALDSIYRKISDPLNEDHLTEDLRRIDFTDAERSLLKLIEVEDWFVPHPRDNDSKIADAVIAGDHSINYNHPEGFAKIALIRGPDTESIFEDPTVHHSLDSAVSSFADSFRVIRPEVQPLAVAGLRRCKTAVERVTATMRELFNGVIVGPSDQRATGLQKITDAIERAHQRNRDLFTVRPNQLSNAGRAYTDKALQRVAAILQDWLDRNGEIPYNPKSLHGMEPGVGKLPFWNCPLKYPPRDENGQPDLSQLSDLERRQLAFAEKIRQIAVELLRAEQWIY